MTISLSETFKLFLDAALLHKPCTEAVNWMNTVNPEISLSEAISAYSSDSGALEGWSHWVVSNMTELDDDALMAFIEEIEDPMLARQLEKDSELNLNEAHKNKLREKWVGKIGDTE